MMTRRELFMMTFGAGTSPKRPRVPADAPIFRLYVDGELVAEAPMPALKSGDELNIHYSTK